MTVRWCEQSWTLRVWKGARQLSLESIADVLVASVVSAVL